jgi:L-ascorbate metabolism protein UlaG (beta-lactamase superfamily)
MPTNTGRRPGGCAGGAASARLVWLGHATVLLDVCGARILTDPVLRRRVAHLVRHGAVPALPDRLDAILVSHLHLDHADIPTLRRTGGHVPVIVPRGAAPALRRAGLADVRPVGVGDTIAITPDVTIRAVPARHDGRRHPLARARSDALGFVVEAHARVYFAGDTDLFDGMAHIGAPGLDVALLPVWGWGTTLGPGHLDPARAARAAALLRPRIAVPIHWGTFLPAGRGRTHRRLLTRPAEEFAARLADEAPGVRAVVLRPGEAFDLIPARDRGAA